MYMNIISYENEKAKQVETAEEREEAERIEEEEKKRVEDNIKKLSATIGMA